MTSARTEPLGVLHSMALQRGPSCSLKGRCVASVSLSEASVSEEFKLHCRGRAVKDELRLAINFNESGTEHLVCLCELDQRINQPRLVEASSNAKGKDLVIGVNVRAYFEVEPQRKLLW